MDATLLGIPLAHYLIGAVAAFAASIVGGLAGYGTGLLLPTIGPEAVVPVIGITAMFTNLGRVAAFRRAIAWDKVRRMAPAAVPMTVLSAHFNAWLSGRGVLALLGLTLLAMVPLRRWVAGRRMVLSPRGLVPAGAAYGMLAGGTTGSGVVLIAMLTAAGLEGAAVIATDAAISMFIGLVKTATFGALGALGPGLVLFAVVIGFASFPGGFMARWLMARMSMRLHAALLDAAILVGAAALLARAWTG